MFSDCVGVYHFMARYHEHLEQPATAQQMKEIANGASLVAQYLLATEYAANNPTPKPYGEFLPYVEARAATKVTAMSGELERGDTEALSSNVEQCGSLLSLQEQLIQQIRDEVYR